jgi:uncharacterized membrane protein (Fun14 family)
MQRTVLRVAATIVLVVVISVMTKKRKGVVQTA